MKASARKPAVIVAETETAMETTIGQYSLGMSNGNSVGKKLTVVNKIEGELVGELDGLDDEGERVGASDGCSVGDEVGALVEDNEGLKVGAGVPTDPSANFTLCARNTSHRRTRTLVAIVQTIT